MTTQDLLEQIQMDYDLETIETTTGRNGYPQCVKKALIGFETFEQAQEIANKYPEICITTFHKRDGWQLWEKTTITHTKRFKTPQVILEIITTNSRVKMR